MYCENPIRSVYVRLVNPWKDSNAYLDCYNSLAYHFTGDFAVAMLTDRECLRFDRNGVQKTEITEEVLERLRNEYQPCIEKMPGKAPWIYYEHTLFCGERIVSVEYFEDTEETAVRFDDFVFRFVTHDSEEDYPSHIRDCGSYYRIRGCERHLKRPCPVCGGEGEMLADFADDFLVRCSSCKKSTGAKLFVQYAIDEWNAGYLRRVIEDEKIVNPVV